MEPASSAVAAAAAAAKSIGVLWSNSRLCYLAAGVERLEDLATTLRHRRRRRLAITADSVDCEATLEVEEIFIFASREQWSGLAGKKR